MTKVVHVTLMIEMVEEADPENIDWIMLLEHVPSITGFSIIDTVLRPYASMEDDPVTHTQH